MAESISMPSSSSPQAASANQAWKVMGRDTPAGKALFSLYGGDHGGKAVGQQFHERNKEQHVKKLASGWSPPVNGEWRCRCSRVSGIPCLTWSNGHMVTWTGTVSFHLPVPPPIACRGSKASMHQTSGQWFPKSPHVYAAHGDMRI